MRPLQPSIRFTLLSALGGILLLACNSSGEKCTPQVQIQPAPNGDTLVLQANSAQVLTASVGYPDKCDQQATDTYEFTWTYDDDGDLILSEAELADAVAGNSYPFFACPGDAGLHLMQISAKPVTSASSQTLSAEFKINIVNAGSIQKPACVDGAISTVKNMQEINADTAAPLRDALDCLEPYLDEINICDVQASYAAGLAGFGAFFAKVPGLIENRNSLSRQDIVDVYNNDVEPILRRFDVVKIEANDDFSFYVDGQFKVLALEDQPSLAGDQTQIFVLQGEHDHADIWAISVSANFARAAFQMLLAYNGLIEWILSLPDPGEFQDFSSIRKLFLTQVIESSTFLTLANDGQERLLSAQQGFVNAFTDLDIAVNELIKETDSQHDDILRYWDCGSDGFCDCNRLDVVNGIEVASNNTYSCPNAQNVYEGPDEDGTEANGKYDPGEPVGTDRLGNASSFDTVDIPSNVKEFSAQIKLLRDNIRGPDAFDLDEIFDGFPVTVFLASTLGLPIPEIRLSEWFATPAHPRELLPFYSIGKIEFLFDSEGEPYEDVGYDGVANAQERITHPTNPLGLGIGEPYDALTNTDPHFDDLDPFCNPVCNDNDAIDNDGDGMIDSNDVWQTGGGVGIDINTDLGVENNLTFDWIDLNDNFTHDADEPSEPFSDIGVTRYDGESIGADNGVWNFADQGHTFPKGADIGPFSDIDQIDPANGSDGYLTEDSNGNPIPVPDDQSIRNALGGTQPAGRLTNYDGLYDSFYFFFADPTFSDVFVLPEEIPSVDQQKLLTENAKLMRFFSKLLEVASITGGGERSGDSADVPPREAYGHLCSDQEACLESLCRWQPAHSLCD